MDCNGRHADRTSRSTTSSITRMAGGLVLGLIACYGWAAEPPGVDAVELEKCPDGLKFKGTSRPIFKGEALVGVMGMLEAQGESNFHPAFDPPKSQCKLEEFAIGTTHVSTVYSPWEKGMSTLHYRFSVDGDDGRREILVIYDGLAGFTFKIKQFFYIVETRSGDTSYYAMFGEEPAYSSAKEIVTAILSAKAEPLATVRWPPGAKEPEIVKYDSKRLK